MSRRWILFLFGGVFTAALAYFLRDAINDRIVVPLAYLWWRLELYYHSITESTWIMLAVMLISLIAYASIMGDIQLFKDSGSRKVGSVLGPVEELSGWLAKALRHTYFRWRVANQLARLARLFLMLREGRNVQRWDGTFDSQGWDPPKDVESYLRYGLNRSVEELQPSSAPWSQSRFVKMNPKKAVEYLESMIGDRFDENK